MSTLDVSIVASSDDCSVIWNGSTWAMQSLTATSVVVGYDTSSALKYGAGLRFQNVTIPQGANITTAYLTIMCLGSRSETAIKCRITGEDTDNAGTFSNITNYATRRGTVVGGANDDNITTAQVDWDNVGAWVASTAYNSPEIKTIIQEIVDRAGWSSGNNLVLFWDDHNARGTQSNTTYRQGASYDHPSLAAPALHIEYSGLAVVSTELCTSVTGSTATGNGYISDLGSSAVTQHGHCWDTSINPTTALSTKTTNGDGSVGAFTSAITGLSTDVNYYIRAYAYNTQGTAYGINILLTAGTAQVSELIRRMAIVGTQIRYIDELGTERYVEGIVV